MTPQRAPRPAGGPGAAEIVDEAIGLIRQRGGRSTTSRRAVLQALTAAGGAHRTAEQLAQEIQVSQPSISESTVYRNLDLLEQLGLVTHVHLGHGPSQWRLKDDQRRWYLTCTICGQVLDADPDTFEAMAATVARETGFTIDAGHFAITGVCSVCAATSSSQASGARR